MRITTLAEYGVICALHLAKRIGEGPVTGRDIAARERLPVDYVEQILLRLRRSGLVKSTRGAHGGYALALTPDEITVRDVIAASELQTFDLHCITHPVEEERCSASHACSIRPVWVMLQQKIDQQIDVKVTPAEEAPDRKLARRNEAFSRRPSVGVSWCVASSSRPWRRFWRCSSRPWW